MSRKTGRKRYIVFTATLILLGLFTVFFTVYSILSSRRYEHLNFYHSIERMVENARLEVQLGIATAYQGGELLAGNSAIIQWLSDDSDSRTREIALSTIQQLMESPHYASAFAASLNSGELYVGDILTDVLSTEDPDDSWFYDSLSMPEDIDINVDYNRELNNTMLWINARVHNKDRIVGVVGVAVEFNSLMQQLRNIVKDHGGPIIITDPSGIVRMASEPQIINKTLNDFFTGNVLSLDDLESINLFNLSPDVDFAVKVPVRGSNLNLLIITRAADFLPPVLGITGITVLMGTILLMLFGGAMLVIIWRLRATILHQNDMQHLTISAMSQLAELKDSETGAHINRTRAYCRILASELSRHPHYRDYLTRDYIEDLERSAPLHDIGKVGIPDSILLKTGKLTDEEFEIIKTHTRLGTEVLRNAEQQFEYHTFFTIGLQLVMHHHEKWDGSGYPDGLAGEEIPLSARIMALADVYDALRSQRPYKPSYSHEVSADIIREGSGRHFQPEIVDAFNRREEDFRRISGMTGETGRRSR